MIIVGVVGRKSNTGWDMMMVMKREEQRGEGKKDKGGGNEGIVGLLKCVVQRRDEYLVMGINPIFSRMSVQTKTNPTVDIIPQVNNLNSTQVF